MKKFQFNLLALVIITSTLFFTACKDDEKDYLSVTPEELEFSGNDSKGQVVEVSSNLNSWRASSPDKWITISEGADDFTVTVEQNIGETRIGKITVKAGEANPVVINVTQTTSGAGGGSIDFSDIPKSNYVATGAPKVLSTPGSSTWNGQVVPDEDGYWAITNFGGEGITVFCDFKDGKIVLDCAYKVAENDTYDGYLRVFYRDNDMFYIQPADYEYYVDYNKTTRTMNFGGTIAGKTAMVAVVAFNKSTGAVGGFFTDGYENLKLVLTPAASSAPQFPNYKANRNGLFNQTESPIMNSGEIVLNLSQVNKMVQIK